MSLLTAEDKILQWFRNAEHLRKVTFEYTKNCIDHCIKHLPHFLEEVEVRCSDFSGSSLEIAHLATITNLKVGIAHHLKTSSEICLHAFKLISMELFTAQIILAVLREYTRFDPPLY
jgi:hypothetical protein